MTVAFEIHEEKFPPLQVTQAAAATVAAFREMRLEFKADDCLLSSYFLSILCYAEIRDI